ncbi:MAG: hypothetical protein E7178_04500 [Erysipelotrichaceae bacterium]|nr:hypothetical protein [Erysipelotrichaceae bacterium]
MQKIMEPTFEIIYLLAGLCISIYILAKSKKRLPYILFGIMGLVLVFGDAFHLVPRIINALEPGVQNIDYYLGIGKLITSITMTVFYVILFWFFKLRYKEKTSLALDFGIYVLAITRIALCLLPFNDWTSKEAPYMWGIYRNIPFVVIGIIMVVLTFIWTRANKDKPFMFVPLAIFLSFIFYIMTVTLTVVHTAFGMMMIPKTVCYVWLLVMGVVAIRKDNKNGEE